MSSLTRKATRRLKHSLKDGEQVLNATTAARIGGMREYAAGALPGLGVVGMVAGNRIGKGGAENIDPRAAGPMVPLPQKCTVVVTDRRFVVFSNTFWRNKPKKVVYEVSRDQIEWIGEPVTDPGVLTKTERVVIGVRGPVVVGWEVPRIFTRHGRALLAELTGPAAPE